jgi:5-methylcytosine-specific restriction endonuclease McrA
VFTRDKGRCTFKGATGSHCGSTRHLQIDHIVPFARGGTNAASNLRLLSAGNTIVWRPRGSTGRARSGDFTRGSERGL